MPGSEGTATRPRHRGTEAPRPGKRLNPRGTRTRRARKEGPRAQRARSRFWEPGLRAGARVAAPPPSGAAGSLTPSPALSCGRSDGASRARCPPARQPLPARHMRRPVRARFSPGAAPFRRLCCCRRRRHQARAGGGWASGGRAATVRRCPPRPAPHPAAPYVTQRPRGAVPRLGAGAGAGCGGTPLQLGGR